MAAHVFWRLGISTGANYVELREVAFLDASQVDLSVGGVASASSEYSAGYAAGYAFDKNTATMWDITAGAFPAWVQYQHAAPVDVAFVRLQSSGYTFSGLTLRHSDDGVLWSAPTDLQVFSGGPIASGAVTVMSPATAFAGLVLPASGQRPMFSMAIPELGLERMPQARFARDIEFGGAGVIVGTVKLNADPVDLPMRRRVRLHREVDGMLVRETWSDASTGAYTFADIDPAYTYTAIAYDYAHGYRAVVADNIAPEVLP